MLRVTTLILPITAPLASSSANEGNVPAAGAAGGGGGGFSPGAVSCADAGATAHRMSAKEARNAAARRWVIAPRSGHRGRSGYLVAELPAPLLRVAQSRR